MSFRRVGRFVCLVAVAALLVGACGEDGDDSPSAQQSSAAKPTVTIGLIAPIKTGLTSFGHDFQNAVNLAVNAANTADAIPGYTIKVRALDDGSDPDKGEAAAKVLADDPTVVGVVGTYNSGVAAKVAPVLDDAGITMVSPGNTDSTLTLGPDATKPKRPWQHYFRMVAADNVQGPFLARQAARLKFTKAAVISETKPVSKGLADEFAANFVQAGGQVVHREVVPDGSTSFATVLQTVMPLQPDLIFFGGEYEVAADLRTEASAAGLTAPLMGGDGIKDDAYIAAAKDDSDGDFASSIGRPVADSESAADFLAAYDSADFKEPAGDFGPYAYDAANVIIAAAAKALDGAEAPEGGSLQLTDDERSTIRDAVQATDVQGASGHVWFDDYGDTKTRVLTLWKVVDGAWKSAITVEVKPE